MSTLVKKFKNIIIVLMVFVFVFSGILFAGNTASGGSNYKKTIESFSDSGKTNVYVSQNAQALGDDVFRNSGRLANEAMKFGIPTIYSGCSVNAGLIGKVSQSYPGIGNDIAALYEKYDEENYIKFLPSYPSISVGFDFSSMTKYQFPNAELRKKLDNSSKAEVAKAYLLNFVAHELDDVKFKANLKVSSGITIFCSIKTNIIEALYYKNNNLVFGMDRQNAIILGKVSPFFPFYLTFGEMVVPFTESQIKMSNNVGSFIPSIWQISETMTDKYLAHDSKGIISTGVVQDLGGYFRFNAKAYIFKGSVQEDAFLKSALSIESLQSTVGKIPGINIDKNSFEGFQKNKELLFKELNYGAGIGVAFPINNYFNGKFGVEYIQNIGNSKFFSSAEGLAAIGKIKKDNNIQSLCNGLHAYSALKLGPLSVLSDFTTLNGFSYVSSLYNNITKNVAAIFEVNTPYLTNIEGNLDLRQMFCTPPMVLYGAYGYTGNFFSVLKSIDDLHQGTMGVSLVLGENDNIKIGLETFKKSITSGQKANSEQESGYFIKAKFQVNV